MALSYRASYEPPACNLSGISLFTSGTDTCQAINVFGLPAFVPSQESALVMSLIAGAICFVVGFLVLSLYEGSQQ